MFQVVFQDGSLGTYQSDGSSPEIAPAALSGARLGNSNVSMYGLIWGWTSNGSSASGVWITGPGLNFPQIFTGPAVGPLWDPHNNLVFFSGGTVYRATFDAYYSDLTSIANLPGEVTPRDFRAQDRLGHRGATDVPRADHHHTHGDGCG